jgi:hypothetical protein
MSDSQYPIDNTMSYKPEYPTANDIRWSRAVELPSLAQIEEMDKKRSQAVEALEISDDRVKCQCCDKQISLLPRNTEKPKSSRVESLTYQIHWLKHSTRYSRSDTSRDALIRVAETELNELLEEDNKADKLRRLPLYSTRLTNFKFYCGKCFENAYAKQAKKR